jgi:hypothetical protein
MTCSNKETKYVYKGITLPSPQNLTANERNNIMVQVVDTLLSSGLGNMNETVAFGIAGNIKAESQFNYTSINTDDGLAYGLCQWHNVRIEKLYDYCETIGKSPNTIDGQLQFLIHELRDVKPYKNAYNTISSEDYRNDIDKIAHYFCMHFEIPGEQYCRNRAENARQVATDYKRLKGQS